MTHDSGTGLYNNEINLRCDGCEKICRSSQLSPVGDGSILVCSDCYSAATAMLSTKPKPALVSQLTPRPLASNTRQVVMTLTPTGSMFQNPPGARSIFTISGGPGPPAKMMNFAHES